MMCEVCGAPTGWVRGQDLASANESKRHAMAEAQQLRAEIERLRAQLAEPRVTEVSCSQCGGSFGPGNSGFSHCSEHAREGATP